MAVRLLFDSAYLYISCTNRKLGRLVTVANKCSIDLTKLVIDWRLAKATANSEPLMILTALITPIVLINFEVTRDQR